ncbi:MAG: hypothetical protein R6X02_02525 [Enhygromyxa sp.]
MGCDELLATKASDVGGVLWVARSFNAQRRFARSVLRPHAGVKVVERATVSREHACDGLVSPVGEFGDLLGRRPGQNMKVKLCLELRTYMLSTTTSTRDPSAAGVELEIADDR